MAFNPCFSVNLQKGVKVLAGVDIFFSIVAIIGSVYVIFCVFLVTNFADSSSSSDEPMGVGRALLTLLTLPLAVIAEVVVAVVLIVAAGILFYAIIQLILAAILFSGANQRNHGRCMIWFVFTIIFTLITAVICCASLASDDDVSAKITAFCFNFIRLVFAIYEIVVVGYFLKELKSENPTANSDEEVKECDSTSQEPGIELSDLSQCPPPDYSSIAETATAPKKAEMDHY